MDQFSVRDEFGCEIEKAPKMNEACLINSRWNFECYDKNGTLKWAEYDRPNIMTHEGLDFLLNVMFHGTSNVAKWYMAIVESNTAAAATMTYAVPAYTECTTYDGGARPEFVEAAASGQAITNSANKCSYTMSDAKTLYGAALVGGAAGALTAEIPGNTGDATGVLMCYSLFSSSKPVENDDVFKTWCTVSAAHA